MNNIPPEPIITRIRRPAHYITNENPTGNYASQGSWTLPPGVNLDISSYPNINTGSASGSGPFVASNTNLPNNSFENNRSTLKRTRSSSSNIDAPDLNKRVKTEDEGGRLDFYNSPPPGGPWFIKIYKRPPGGLGGTINLFIN